MKLSHTLLGVHLPGDTVWHRLGVGWKYLVFLALVLPALVAPSPWLIVALLGVATLLLAWARVPLRLALGVPWPLAVMLGALAAYHVLTGRPQTAVAVLGTTALALYAGRLILFTTPLPVLIDALVAAVRPLRVLGVRPERFGLAVGVLIRSIPFLASSFEQTRDAVRARGLDPHPATTLTPVAISAVAYARRTGEALTARGLGDDD